MNQEQAEALVAEARLAAELAYAPYSAFRVGAVVVTDDGTRIAGANVENAAYPATLCAESNAIGTAAAAGHRKVAIVAVASLDGDDTFPCGNCRQVMREFGVEHVAVQRADGRVSIHSLDEILPHSFGPEHLPAAD